MYCTMMYHRAVKFYVESSDQAVESSDLLNVDVDVCQMRRVSEMR